MRNIKFRGKTGTTEGKKWVYGYLYKIKSFFSEDYQYFIKNEHLQETSVDEDTIGQYTGLKDRNMKEIYEGDIVLIDAYTYPEPEFSEEYLVEYNELLEMWELKNLEDNKDIKTFEDLNGWYKLDIELLGNIYDNPELLEKGE